MYLEKTGSMVTKLKAKRRRRCVSCKKVKRDVRCRPDVYSRDVCNQPKAEWLACNRCDADSRVDI